MTDRNIHNKLNETQSQEGNKMTTEIKKDEITGEEVTVITLINGNKLTIKENEVESTVRLSESNFGQPIDKIRGVTLRSNNKDGLNVGIHTTMKKTDTKIRQTRDRGTTIERKNWMEEHYLGNHNMFHNVINIYYRKRK